MIEVKTWDSLSVEERSPVYQLLMQTAHANPQMRVACAAAMAELIMKARSVKRRAK